LLELKHSVNLTLLDSDLPGTDADTNSTDDDVTDVDQEEGSQGTQEYPSKVVLNLHLLDIGGEAGKYVHHK
jgi:hypothetical protein